MTTSTSFRLAAAAALALLLPAAATAQTARAAKAVNVRAGPGRDYPLVVQVGAGTPLAVQGCLDNYSWCDVVVPGPNYRGWVYAGNIVSAYQSAEVPLIQYGAVIGLPIVGFALGSYWGDYYRDRPWYRDRGRWASRPVPHGPAFRPGPRQGFDGPRPGRPGVDVGRPPDRQGRLVGRPPSGSRFEGAGRPDNGDRFGGDRPGGRGDRGGGDHRGGQRGGGPQGAGQGGDRGHGGGGRER